MEAPVNKSRTPSRCREWERNRRNKFNDAISRLGEVVKEINRANSGSKDADNVQYPKVEIVEKAIICLTTSVQEKAQLKSEILALQVQIENEKKQKENKKDVSTQVFIGINKKSKNDKFVKVVMLRKSKRKALEEKSVLTVNATVDSNVETSKLALKAKTLNTPPKLPVILPKTNFSDKKGPENTIVVLPAAPYIFPQRPLLLPTVPPTYVLVDQNLQALNKPHFPLMSRSNSDITKTTMVNILPISAYSRPLSASKVKKNSKSKIDFSKKLKKPKQVTKLKEQPVTVATSIAKSLDEITIENKEKESNVDSGTKGNQPQHPTISESSKTLSTDVTKNMSENGELTPHSTINSKNNTASVVSKVTDTTTKTFDDTTNIVKIVPNVKNTVTRTSTDRDSNISEPMNPKTNNTENENEKNKTEKGTIEKEQVDKNKENKLPNILDTALCENTVDGGNARLELAEEFLAASPTAAFLMSFPLVSGNRADSPTDEPSQSIPIITSNTKDNNQRRSEVIPHSLPYFEKPAHVDTKARMTEKSNSSHASITKQTEQLKYVNSNSVPKDMTKISNTVNTSNTSNENPFLNLSMSSLLPTSCTLSDTTFGLDFDCSISKSIPVCQSTNYVSNSNIFYKSDPFSTVKSTIYSTSSISSGHEFNSFGLYPCAMEKYSTKNKTDYSNVEDNLMKIGSSRLTYDIDLGWSHKSFDFVSSSSASNTFNKDSILTTTAGSYSTSYNPFTTDFHVPLVSTSNKKESTSSKHTSSYPDTITSFYSQPTNLWSEEVPFYTNNSTAKTFTSRHQNYLSVDHTQMNMKQSSSKQYDLKQTGTTGLENVHKSSHTASVQVSEKYKKSPSKMHINWMTSEIRPMQTNCNPTHTELKDTQKPNYGQLDQTPNKKQDHNENSYFPISMHNFPPQTVQEELQAWPSTRPAGTTEISIDPPPINLPTLVGDLALGPHDKKKTIEATNRSTQPENPNCSNFFSVTQLMNRSTDHNIQSRYQSANNTGIENQNTKAIQPKQHITNTTNDHNRKPMSNTESHITQPCYLYDSKTINSYENLNQFSHKTKLTKADKNSKSQKNSYSAEALIRGGSCNQKLQDNNAAKFMIPSQKYNEFNPPQDISVAQVSHFPPLLDYSENSYTGQQFSGTNLYNTTTNTISNSFYSNFMSGSSNLMPGNYSSAPFSGDFIDFNNQTAECSYPNHKYTELKIRNNSTTFQQEKTSSNYKSSRKESAAKHKLECSKKDSNKKCQTKRAKLNNEVDEWSDTSHMLWQNKASTKRHSNIMPEELSFPNYMGNQMAAAAGQYQPDFFNSHIMSSNMQPVGHNVDRSLANFPTTSRANFNLSTIFPEITMKVQ